MQLHRPLGVISTSVSTDVLTVLARAEAEFTPPEVHRLVGAHSEAGIRRALQELSRQGIVHSARSGNAVRYWLNRQHLAASHIRSLAGLREELVERLTRRIGLWKEPCAYAALFGSAARNEMTLDSDIDLFVVRPAAVDPEDGPWARQIRTLEVAVTTWTGNDARVLEYGEAEVVEGSASGDRVLDDIRDEGLRLAGPSDYLRS